MLYQRRIADNQIVSAKLELHLRGSRYAGVGAQLLGIVSLGFAVVKAAAFLIAGPPLKPRYSLICPRA